MSETKPEPRPKRYVASQVVTNTTESLTRARLHLMETVNRSSATLEHMGKFMSMSHEPRQTHS